MCTHSTNESSSELEQAEDGLPEIYRCNGRVLNYKLHNGRLDLCNSEDRLNRPLHWTEIKRCLWCGATFYRRQLPEMHPGMVRRGDIGWPQWRTRWHCCKRCSQLAANGSETDPDLLIHHPQFTGKERCSICYSGKCLKIQMGQVFCHECLNPKRPKQLVIPEHIKSVFRVARP